MIYSSLSFSMSPILCSSLDIGPRNTLSFLIGWSPELIELSLMLACPKYCSFAVPLLLRLVLKVMLFAVSSIQANNGRSAGRHAARIPTLVSTLARRLASRDCTDWGSIVLRCPDYICVVAVGVSLAWKDHRNC